MMRRGLWLGMLVTGLAVVLWGLVGQRSAAGGAADQFVYLPLVARPISTTPSLNLTLNSGSYLGGSGGDGLASVDITPDGRVVVAGTMPNHNPGGVTPTLLLGGGDGVIVVMDSDGQMVQSVTRLGNLVWEVVVGSDGRILACGDFGVALLNAAADSVVWSVAGLVDRCDLGGSGTVAALANDTVVVFDANGNELGRWDNPGQNLADVAVDDASQSVIATGYEQAASNLQVPLIKAWSFDGSTLRWTAYDFSASAVFGQNLGADSRGHRVAMGRDGMLYFVGHTDGGNTVFTRSPQDVAVKLGSSTLIKTDRYNDPYQLSGSLNIGWYGRFDPATGELERGQFLLTRLSNGNGNSIQVDGVMADENGRLYLVGQAYARLDNRDNRMINGTAVGAYSGGESFLLIVTPDFKTRVIWTPFTGDPSAGGTTRMGVNVRNGTAVAVIYLSVGSGNLITVNPLQPARAGDDEAYVAIWLQSGE